MKSELIREFHNLFHREPQKIFFCPGRINLIGEHIDYNGGRVMPCSISQGTWLAVSKNTDKKINLHATLFPETVSLHLQTSYSKTGSEWFNYPLGIISHFAENGAPLSGLDMLFTGNIPVGAGLSSSASIEVITAFAIDKLFALNFPILELIRLSKKIENEFIGVNCGIMDQFAVAMGRADRAILLDCHTLEYEYLPLNLDEYSLVIINTNKPRRLIESRYNERFAECGQALKLLKAELDVQQLCDISPSGYMAHRHLLHDPALEKRARHVIQENARVGEAAEALKKGDLISFGKLMYASHQSLKENYEVSGKELDTIVDFCRSFPHCLGARMTGAGFGGCAIALIKQEHLDPFTVELSAFYEQRVGYKPSVILTEIKNGVMVID